MENVTIETNTIPGRRYPIRRVQLVTPEPTLTKESFTKAVNIKTIIEKAKKTGILGDPNAKPIFGDFTQVNPENFLNSLNIVAQEKAKFEALDPKLRERFGNKPENLLEFMADPANEEESIKLKLRPEKKKPNPEPANQDPSKAT